jgi:L-lactate dehydrogenase
MRISGNKVVVVGAGQVGATVAFSLVVQEVCAEVVLININELKASGEALDIDHGIEYLGRNTKITAGSYADCKDADIVVLTVSAPFQGETSRLQMMDKSAAIIKNVVPSIMESGFDGIFIVVSNPVDIMSYLVYKLSGLPKSQVIGTGTALETARLKQNIGRTIGIDPKNVEAFAIGEHGDSLVVPWSHVRAGGKSIYQILKDNQERFANLDLAEIEQTTRKAGFEVVRRKGNTQYGIASTTTGIISAILRDEYKTIPVSTLLQGEYGVKDIFCGVPAILNGTGVNEIINLHLEEKEQIAFIESANVIKSNIERLGL